MSNSEPVDTMGQGVDMISRMRVISADSTNGPGLGASDCAKGSKKQRGEYPSRQEQPVWSTCPPMEVHTLHVRAMLVISHARNKSSALRNLSVF